MVVACFRVVAGGMEHARWTREMCRRHALQACPVTQLCLTLWNGLPFPSAGALSTQGSNLHLLHWQVDSLQLRHLESPYMRQECPNCMMFWHWNWNKETLVSGQSIDLPFKHFIICSCWKNRGKIYNPTNRNTGFPCSSVSKESVCNTGGLGSIPVLGRASGEGNCHLLQYSCLENPMDRGAWQVTKG